MIKPVLLLTALLGGAALAQPAPPPGDGKVDAKSLMASGVRLLEAKDYLGALAVFKDAYRRFPSAKILLNIGTTLNLLDRKAEAANAYQRYLDSADTDPARKADVTSALAELDKTVGRLEISVTPADAEVQVNTDEWIPAARAAVVRVPQGAFTVRARKDKFQPETKSAQITAGERAGVVIALTALPEEPAPPVTGGIVTGPVVPPPTVAAPRSRLGLLAKGHFDVPRGGGAGLVGVTFDVIERMEVHGTAIIGPKYGAYAGASYAFLGGKTRPFAAAGIPVFFSNGARVGVRGAGGVELRITRQFSALAELGAEVMLNPEDNILRVAFIPAVGVSGRL